MALTPYGWADFPLTTTPITAAALEAFAAHIYAASTTDSQPVDTDLTAIAALTTTAYGRAFLALADAAAARTALGLGTAATQATGAFDSAGAAAAAQAASQPVDADLTAIAALSTTSFGRAFLSLADAAAARTAVGAAAQTGLDALDTRVGSVESAVAGLGDALTYRGAINASSNPNYPAADAGHVYKISAAGKIGGGSGTNVEIGDSAICTADGTSAGTQAAVGASWTIIQGNIDGAVIGPASSTDSDLARFDGTNGKLIKAGVALDTDAALAAASAVRVPSQGAVKTYADAIRPGRFRGLFAATTDYRANDMVLSGSTVYAALADFTSGATFDATNWRALTASQLTSSPAFAQQAASLLVDRTADVSRGSNSNGVNTDANSRLKFYVNRPTNTIVLVVGGMATWTVNSLNAVTDKFSIELASGTVIPVYFPNTADGRSVVTQPGTMQFSLPVGLPIGLTAGDYIYVRTRTVVTAGQFWSNNYCTDAAPTAGGGPAEGAEKGVGTTDKVDAGTITVSYDNVRGPLAVLGDQFSTGRGPVAAVGDSITRGAGSAQESWAGSTTDFWGAVRKACYLSNPVTNVGLSGDTAQVFAASGGLRRVLAAAARYIVFGLGINDLVGGRTAAQLEADLITSARGLTANGGLCYQNTITPKTTSTDSWATVGNQTAFAGEAARVTVNTWIRAGMPIDPTTKAPVAIGTGGALTVGQFGHPIVNYIEMANVVESAQDSGKFKAITGATGDRTNASPTILNATSGAWVVGSPISGTGIPTDTRVTAVAGSTLTMSKNATSTGAGGALTSTWTADGLHLVNIGNTALAAVVPVSAFV